MFLLNHNFIDPLPLYELGPMKGLLSREEMNVPEQTQDETEDVYRQRLMVVCLHDLLLFITFINFMCLHSISRRNCHCKR